VLMEAVPADLAAYITKRLTIPTIGIGAGISCDGQVLITHEMFGLFPGFGLPFGKRYAEAGELIRNGMKQYHQDVLHGSFPEAVNSFPIDAEMIRRLEAGE
jgi:3-methyl-2-oxobutanoate hydroxymethyltransferase